MEHFGRNPCEYSCFEFGHYSQSPLEFVVVSQTCGLYSPHLYHLHQELPYLVVATSQNDPEHLTIEQALPQGYFAIADPSYSGIDRGFAIFERLMPFLEVDSCIVYKPENEVSPA